MVTDQLIAQNAEQLCQVMSDAVAHGRSEEDIRIAMTGVLNEFIRQANLDIRGRHEYALAGGRVDSRFGAVIIEYKEPHGPDGIGESPTSQGAKKVVDQLKRRFGDFERQEHVSPARIFGVGCDGRRFVFTRFRGARFDVEAPQPVTPHTAARLLGALVSVGARGRSFTAEELASSFGSDSPLAQQGLRDIYEAITGTEDPKAITFFRQWKILFGEVCGYDVTGSNPKMRRLAEHYGIPAAEPASLLFSLHTYYAIFIKFLAAQIAASFNPLGLSVMRQSVNAPSSEALRAEMRNLEQGGIWAQMGISNFLEGDLFSWYLTAWDGRMERAVRGIVGRLYDFDPNTLSAEPTESRDLLKHLYHSLFPRSVRHDLGEYYTPDWLAEFTLQELGYDGNPDTRLLDPACGSGTFLVMAINRVKAWFAENRHQCGYQEGELAGKILNNIIGFDLNPLAVMAARTNYLLSIRDLLRYAAPVEVPVYLCDAIVTPSELGPLFAGRRADRRALRTAVGRLEIPTDISENQDAVGRWTDALDHCLKQGYGAEEFLTYCVSRGVTVETPQLHRSLYEKLLEVQREGRNGIWARVIKNAFAPVFVGKVDLVAGNPPWVNWESLPEDYRDETKRLWAHYGLFTLSGAAARLGGGKKDLSMLFAYVAVDKYLRDGGKLGFVITQSVFKTQGAGDGFRQFVFNDPAGPAYLRPTSVHDLSTLQVFEGATNRTAVFVCEKAREAFRYPVRYTIWGGANRVHQDRELAEVLNATTRADLAAIPVKPGKRNSPWLTTADGAVPGVAKAIGASEYAAHAGVFTGGLNGCFWVRTLGVLPDGQVLVENLHDVGKIKVEHVQAVVEPGLVYPLLRGRDVHRWATAPSAQIILAQDPATRLAIPEASMKANYPKVYAYLRRFETQLRQRKTGAVRAQMASGPFYSMFAVGPYTVAPWKAMWRDMGSRIQVAVAGRHEGRVICPEHHVMFVPFQVEEAAHYLCALLMSSPVQALVSGYTTTTGISTHVLQNAGIPRFNEKLPLHQRLAVLSAACHEATATGDAAAVAVHGREIDALAAEMWGITEAELSAIHEALAMVAGAPDEEDDEGED